MRKDHENGTKGTKEKRTEDRAGLIHDGHSCPLHHGGRRGSDHGGKQEEQARRDHPRHRDDRADLAHHRTSADPHLPRAAEHDGDAESVYQNLAEDVAVSVGDTVKSGEVLGAVGESALIEIAEEPHLHFALRVAGKSVNPLDYISAATMTIVYDE